MMILRICIEGRWFDVKLTKEEIDEVKLKNLKDNIAVAMELSNELKAKLSESVIAGIIENHTQHFIYRLTNYATLKKIKELEEKAKTEPEWPNP